MNIIGIMTPKIVSLLTILRPGHSGNIYKLTKGVGFEVGELIVLIIQFIPAVTFLLATILMRTWIPFVPGVIAAFAYFSSIVCCIKDIIVEGKRRRGKNANSNSKK